MMSGMLITIGTLVFTFAIIGVVLYVLYLKVWKPMQASKAILQNGLPGKARVLAIADTGMTVNDSPSVRLTLEVTPDNRMSGPYQTELRTLINRLQVAQFQPGARLLIKYDPNNPMAVAIAGIAVQHLQQ